MGSVLGSAIETVGQVETNERNIEMQRETNAQNYKIFQEGNEFNRQEAEKNRDFESQEAIVNRSFQQQERESAQDFNEMMYRKYQSPEAQAGAFSRLGINPNAISGHSFAGVSGSSGMPGSMPSGSQAQASPAPSMVAPRSVNPFGGLAGTLISAFSTSAQAKLANAQAKNVQIKNMYEEQRQEEEINKIMQEADKILEDKNKTEEEKHEAEKRKEIAGVKLEILRNTQRDVEEQTQMDTFIKAQDLKSRALDIAYKEFENEFYPQLMESQLNLNEAQARSLLSNANAAMISATSMRFDSETHRYEYRFDKHKFKTTMKRYFDSMSDLNEAKTDTEGTVQELNLEKSSSERQGRRESKWRIKDIKHQMLDRAVTQAQNAADKVLNTLVPWY